KMEVGNSLINKNFLAVHYAMEYSFLGTPDECKSAEFVPGYNLGGEGVDIVTMENKQAYMINMEDYLNTDEKCTLIKNPFLENKVQKLPMAMVDWRPSVKCSATMKSVVFDSSESLVNETSSVITNDWKVGLSFKTQGSVVLAGSHSKESQFSMERTKHDKTSFSSQTFQCQHYSYRLIENPPLLKHFSDSIQKLPKRYKKMAYQKIIDTYGTHFITHVSLGGKVKTITAIKTCEAALNGVKVEDVKDCLDVEASTTIKGTITANTAYKYCEQKKKNLKIGDRFSTTFSDRKTFIQGGNSNIENLLFSSKLDPNAYKNWLESTKSIPGVIQYSLEPLHMLIQNDTKKKRNMRLAISKYIQRNGFQTHCSSKCKDGSFASKHNSCLCVCNENPNFDNMCCPRKLGIAELSVRVNKAEGLYGDTWSQTDGYVKVFFGDKKLQTNIIYENNNPVWNMDLDFGTVELSMIAQIKVEVWDEDNAWYKWWHDYLGGCTISIKHGNHKKMCTLNHGTVHFSYTIRCAPSLGGETCRNYQPSPISTSLMDSFVSRNAIPITQSSVSKWNQFHLQDSKIPQRNHSKHL
uniref:Perforin-1-like n=1 Tax=Erpetoichthys calabaricus TaxID=27687 RepID=A0A8C4XG47_ERPCA